MTEVEYRKLLLNKQAEYRRKGWSADALARYARAFNAAGKQIAEWRKKQ